jgi:Na+/H+ antiporter NhaD/arsenite permease-like protein
MSTITFFIGILLAVNALNFMGILDQFAMLIFGETAAVNGNEVIFGNILLGLFS